MVVGSMGTRKTTVAKRKVRAALSRRIANAEVLIVLFLVGATALLTLVFGGVLQAGNYLYSMPEDAGDIVLRPAPIWH